MLRVWPVPRRIVAAFATLDPSGRAVATRVAVRRRPDVVLLEHLLLVLLLCGE
jgi:hypothetical protein